MKNQLKDIKTTTTTTTTRKANMKVQVSSEKSYHSMNTTNGNVAGNTGQEKLAG